MPLVRILSAQMWSAAEVLHGPPEGEREESGSPGRSEMTHGLNLGKMNLLASLSMGLIYFGGSWLIVPDSL